MSEVEREFREFLSKYAGQLKASSVPESLWGHVFLKVRQKVFDGEHVFERFHEAGQTVGKLRLKNEDLQPNSDLFVIPHVFSAPLKDLAAQLQADPDLVERLSKLMGNESRALAPDFDAAHADMVSIVMEQAQVTEAVAKSLLIQNRYELLPAIMSAHEGPETEEEIALKNKIMGGVAEQRGSSEGESPLTWNCPGYSVDQATNEIIEVRIPVPKGTKSKDIEVKFSPAYVKAGLKGSPPIVDVPLPHRIVSDESTWTLEKSEVLVLSIQKEEDKVWKEFGKGEARIQKKVTNPKLLEAVLANFWKYAQLYQMQVGDSNRSVWYVNDELASAIWHSDIPNVMTCPFLYLNEKNEVTSYTLLWPISMIQAGEVITRSYLPAGLTSDKAEAYLCAWESDQKALKTSFLESCARTNQESLKSKKSSLDLTSLNISSSPPPCEIPKIFSDIAHIKSQISKKLEVSSVGDANVLWVTSSRAAQMLDALQETQRIFYCPSRTLFTSAGMTSLFSNSHITQKKILPTFTLPIQLNQFVSEYYFRDEYKEPNHWVMTPDATIFTNNLAQLIRQVDYMKTLSCSLYPIEPCLIGSKSFCLSLPFVITKFHPLQVHIGSEVNVHFAEVPFKEGTVFNHPDQFVQSSRNHAASETADFITRFTKQHPKMPWNTILESIQQTIREVLTSLVPMALEKAPQEEVVKSGNFFYTMSAEVLLDKNCKPYLRTFHDIHEDLAPKETEEIIKILSGVGGSTEFGEL